MIKNYYNKKISWKMIFLLLLCCYYSSSSSSCSSASAAAATSTSSNISLTTSTISRNAGTRYDCHSGHGERSNSHILCKATWLCFSQGLLNRKSTMARDALSGGTGAMGSVLGFTITCTARSPVYLPRVQVLGFQQ